MFPRVLPLATATLLYVSGSDVHAAPAVLESLNLLEQAGSLPEDFRDHFFEVPLIVRVEVDGRYLGDARALLNRENQLSLLDFVDVSGSDHPAVERDRWLTALAVPRALGPCSSACPNGLVGMHYSLESSLLSIASNEAASAGSDRRHHAMPERDSGGAVVRHQLNAYGGEGMQFAGRYALDMQASAGNWTMYGYYQVDRGGEQDAELRHSIQSLYAQREYNDHFLRVGYFLPNFQGVTRQPRTAGAINHTTAGIMAGSSDSLLIDSRTTSLYPVYVTADREGSVEVYRNGSLIFTQALQPGLQQVDTRRLPGGIYEVELRVIEDGRETSRERAVIHKPAQWRDTGRRWRYSAFAGVQRSVLDTVDDPEAGEFAVGGVVNYLAHARAIVGVAAQQLGNDRAIAGSLDWQVSDRANVYTNAYTSSIHGSGVDVQALVRYRHGSVTVSHNRSWQERPSRVDNHPPSPDAHESLVSGWLHTSALGVSHRLGEGGHVSARISHHRGVSSGTGVDLSLSRRQTLFGTDATWRASVFDRPANTSSGMRRDRGVDFTLNIALGAENRRYSGAIGSRTAVSGDRDLYVSAGVQQLYAERMVRGLAGQVTVDGDGLGLSGNAQFEHASMRGDIHAQRSSFGGGLSAGMNVESTVAVGQGRMAIAGAGQLGATGAGMIVDVRSDIVDVDIRAHDSHGASYVLRPGRNLLPVTAYRAGSLQLDFGGRSAPAATIQPAVLAYHLNKGGVGYGMVDVINTVTVMGQLRSADGRPLAGAHIINHASRTVAEADGFFAIEMSARLPTLEVRHRAVTDCSFTLDGKRTHASGDAWMAGILQCPSGTASAGFIQENEAAP